MKEYSKEYRNEDGIEVEIKIKAECISEEDLRKALAFMAQSSRSFYLEAGNVLKTEP